MWKETSKRVFRLLVIGSALGAFVGFAERSLSTGVAVGGGLLTLTLCWSAAFGFASNVRFAVVERESLEWEMSTALALVSAVVIGGTLALIDADPEAHAATTDAVIASAIVGVLFGLGFGAFDK